MKFLLCIKRNALFWARYVRALFLFLFHIHQIILEYGLQKVLSCNLQPIYHVTHRVIMKSNLRRIYINNQCKLIYRNLNINCKLALQAI